MLVTIVASFASEIADALYRLAFGPEGSGNLVDFLELKVDGQPIRGLPWLPASVLGLAGIAGCVVGLLVGVLQGIGFRRLHRSTPTRSVVALLLPLAIPAVLWLLKSLGWLGGS